MISFYISSTDEMQNNYLCTSIFGETTVLCQHINHVILRVYKMKFFVVNLAITSIFNFNFNLEFL